MKLLICTLAAVMLSGLVGGCMETPAYSSGERFDQIKRNIHYEGEQFNDDVDHFLMLRPASRDTIWNVYHRN